MSHIEVITAVAAVVICSILFIYSKFRGSFQYWKKRNIPYFEPRFLRGNLKHPSEVLEYSQKAYKKGWKYFGVYDSAKPLFVPLDMDLIKCIMSKDFNHFTDRFDGTNIIRAEENIMTENLFALRGAKWRSMRVKLTPTFTSGKLKQMFQTIVDCGINLEEIIKEHNGEKPIDVRDLMACFTTDSIVSCAFGLEGNCFKDPDSPFAKYGKNALGQSQSRISKINWFIRIMFFSFFPKLAKAMKMKLLPDEMSNFYFDFVSKAVDYREKNNYTRNDFLQLLINMRNKNDQKDGKGGDSSTLSMTQLVAQCFLFFLAGFATSSTTMTFALCELAMHPEIQEKVRKEILEVLEKHDNKICYDSIKDMEYLQQVVEESLRKYPPVPFIPRACNEDYKIPGTDIVIEKGTNIVIPIKTIHYMESNYKNPDTFDPERFSQAEKEKRHPFAHIPFGEGPRVCIGMRFGIMQSKVGLVSVLRNHRVKLNPKTKYPITIDHKKGDYFVEGGLWLDVEEA